MKSIIRFIAVLLLLIGPAAYAQTDTLRFSVRGTVRDAANGRVLPYVSVTLPGTNYATVTNQDGTFVIKSAVVPRFVAFSLLGYKVLTVPADRERDMRVSLTRGEYTLDPAQVISGDPLTILREAMYKITDNCPSEPELFDRGLLISQLCTRGRLAPPTAPSSSLYAPRYDETAVQMVLNMIDQALRSSVFPSKK